MWQTYGLNFLSPFAKYVSSGSPKIACFVNPKAWILHLGWKDCRAVDSQGRRRKERNQFITGCHWRYFCSNRESQWTFSMHQQSMRSSCKDRRPVICIQAYVSLPTKWSRELDRVIGAGSSDTELLAFLFQRIMQLCINSCQHIQKRYIQDYTGTVWKQYIQWHIHHVYTGTVFIALYSYRYLNKSKLNSLNSTTSNSA